LVLGLIIPLTLAIAFLIMAALAVRSDAIREKIPFLRWCSSSNSGYIGMSTQIDDPDEVAKEEEGSKFGLGDEQGGIQQFDLDEETFDPRK